MRALTWLLTCLLIYFLYQLGWGKNGYMDYLHYQQEVAQIKQENANKIAQNARMFAQIRDLKEGTDAVEEQAREEDGMVKADEVFYRIMGEKEK